MIYEKKKKRKETRKNPFKICFSIIPVQRVLQRPLPRFRIDRRTLQDKSSISVEITAPIILYFIGF
jgi:hypothetical protein